MKASEVIVEPEGRRDRSAWDRGSRLERLRPALAVQPAPAVERCSGGDAEAC